LDKSAIVQEARVFNDTPLNPRKCCTLLSKVLFLIYNGEVFSAAEATSLFFGVTKAFQSKEVSLAY
jgi:coatomer protein complex subunit gamma